MTDKPAVVVNRYGKGEAMLIGTYLGMANHPVTTAVNNSFILGLASWAGVSSPVHTSHDGVSDDPVIARLQENDNGLVLFLINHGEKQEKVTATVTVEEDGEYTIHEITGDKTSVISSANRVVQIETELPGRDARIWEIRYNP
ncbi:MAG: hypothetical protein ACFCU6_10170, partial [Balneolaceae bacterium]